MYTLSGPFVLALPALRYLTGWRKVSLQKAIRKTEAHLQKSRDVYITLMSDLEEMSVAVARVDDDEFLVCTGKQNSGCGVALLREQLDRITADLQINVEFCRSETANPEMCLVAMAIRARVDSVSMMIEGIFHEVAGYTLRDRVIMQTHNLDRNDVPFTKSITL